MAGIAGIQGADNGDLERMLDRIKLEVLMRRG